jgi:Tfp pilus assembly protein PilX
MSRLRGDRGAGMVVGLVLMFAFTAGAVIWLARDVDRSISNRSAAQSIAFQAARSGAQQLDVAALRRDAPGAGTLDDGRVRLVAAETADRLLGAYRLHGQVTDISVLLDRVTVTVEVTDGGRTVTGIGSARAVEGARKDDS